MIKKTKPQGKAAPVREGLAYLIEDALERSEVVIAAESIVEQLQKIAEDLASIEAKDIMPLLDALTNSFGPDVAQSFNSVATEQVRQLVSAVQGAKTALDGEILRLKKGIEGGDVSDMAMDASKPMMPSGVPSEPGMGGPEPGMGEPPLPDGTGVPSPDMAGNAEDDMMGGFAGRGKKESAAPKGKLLNCRIRGKGRRGRMGESRKKVMEYETAPTRAVGEPHSHESGNFAPNLSNLGVFHGGAGKLAHSVANMIRTEELSLEQRKSLANVLSHLAAFAAEPAHWSGVDADKKLEMSLQSAGIWEARNPAVQKIVAQLKRLCHLLSLHHDSMLESNISMLRKASNPDALILKTFRLKLAENNRDGQMAAIRTARTFAIDIEDVVAVVKEAAARRPFRETKQEPPVKRKIIRLAEFKGDESQYEPPRKPKPKGNPKFGGKQAKPFGKKEEVDEDMPPTASGTGQPASVQQPAVNGQGQPAQTVPMFPVEQGSPVTAAAPTAATNSNAMQATQMQPPANQSNSTIKPLTPANSRAQQAQIQQQKQQQETQVQPNPQRQQPQGQQPNPQGQPTNPQGQSVTPGQQPPLNIPGVMMTTNNPALKRATLQK